MEFLIRSLMKQQIIITHFLSKIITIFGIKNNAQFLARV